MSVTININGQLLPPHEAKISVFDRGFLFGDSIYEVTYSKNRSFIFLDEHLDRLWNSARLIGMDIQLSRREIAQRIIETAKASDLDSVYARIIVTRGEGEISLHYEGDQQNVIVFIKPNVVYPDELYQRGLNLALVSRPRNDRRSLDPNAKSGNYLNNVLALQEAKRAGADDAIMMNIDGEVAEGTTFNVWIVKDGKTMTPHAQSGLLKGITRQKVLDICKRESYPCEETSLRVQDLRDADEIFITSSTKGIMPVYKLDGKTYAEKPSQRPVTETLMGKYRELVNEHIQERRYFY